MLMPNTPEDEERLRVARARENVENWQRKYGGFSGGFRVTYGDGRQAGAILGDPALAQKVMGARIAQPVENAHPVQTSIPPTPAATIVYVTKSRRARFRWLACMLNLISVEE